ncbi:MAG: hypothetical protein KDA92_01840 [Planctomycetales bacterium]|nr:hypothetical protein [Planctomycetales bacterium]MCA9166325.1 hypothetical protein [Planctomycetales bacterium]
MTGVYKFEPSKDGFDVLFRGKSIGLIKPSKEASGRHCFYLGCDDRKDPRTYRGKIKAAEALHTIFKLTAEAKKKKWSPEKLLVMAWDDRPRASDAPE